MSPLSFITTTLRRAFVVVTQTSSRSLRMASTHAGGVGPHDQRIVWVDCEMTGLDHTRDKIIEIAVIITDKELNVVAEGPNLVIHQPKEIMDNMNAWCIDHHGKSGLTQKVLESKISVQDADQTVTSFVKQWVPAKKCPLAGNSVGEDKKFLEKYMPNFYDHLHYRIIDVSTIKELSKRWYPAQKEGAPPKKMTHLAMDDIRESIDELIYYKTAVFK